MRVAALFPLNGNSVPEHFVMFVIRYSGVMIIDL